MVRVLEEIFWSNSLSGKLGRLFGVLSLISLARYAFHFGISELAASILSYYSEFVKVALGWFDPYMRAMVHDALVALRINMHFSELWRHVFVVLWILFARDAGVAFADRRPVTGLFRLLVGAVIALLISLFASSTYENISGHFQNIMIAFLPVLGIYAYDVIMYLYSTSFQIEYLNAVDKTPGRTRLGFLKRALGRGTRRFILGLAMIVASFFVPAVWQMDAPAGGFVALAAATVANVSYWLWRGAAYAAKARTNGMQWLDVFKQSEAGRFGIAVTSVFAWIAVFIVVNAGLKQLGL